jgi:MFS family permease
VVLTAIVITCSFGGFGMSHQQVIPAMAKEVLGVGAAGVGLLFLASGIGSFLGNFLLPIIGSTKVYRSLLINLVLFAIFLSFFSWSSWFWVSWIFFLLVGLVGLGSVWPLATSLIQLESPADMKGRVMGILQFTPGFHYLGAYPLALAAGQFGWGVAMTATAVATLLVTIWFGVIRSGAPAINIQINKENSAD